VDLHLNLHGRVPVSLAPNQGMRTTG
jgi:hypothetical protein